MEQNNYIRIALYCKKHYPDKIMSPNYGPFSYFSWVNDSSKDSSYIKWYYLLLKFIIKTKKINNELVFNLIETRDLPNLIIAGEIICNELKI